MSREIERVADDDTIRLVGEAERFIRNHLLSGFQRILGNGGRLRLMAESKEGETGPTIFFEGEGAQKVLSEIFSSPLNDHPQNSTK